MKGLIIKDFKLLKNQKQFFVLMAIVCLLPMLTAGEPSFLVSYITILFSLFTISTISYDVYDNGLAFLFTLPITRRTYVAAKYAFGLLIVLSSLGASLILSGIGYTLKGISCDPIQLLFIAASSFFVATLMLSVSIPIQLKFGPEKSRIAMLLAYGVCFGLVYGLVTLLRNLGIDLDSLGANFSRANDALLFVGAVVVCIAIGAISYLASVGIMRKKEF